ncbi:MAG: protein kinase domain-containing protein [Gemmatimonadales bacterium]
MSDLRERIQTALGSAYRVERELGTGGMGVVFLAEELALGRRVVVKVLRPELAAGLSAERFRREVQLAAALQHPHIVPLFAAGEAGGLLYYTMPFIAGESLRARLRREGELPVPDALRVLGEVLDALEHAHAQGIIHRDIKPENVLFSGTHALVADFGVAKALSAAVADPNLTGTGLALGAPAYMAPEQAAGDAHVDHRADLYAAGVEATPPLERVTTASLPALRKYTRAFDLLDYGGESDQKRGLALLEEAVALDTAFAMAYRKLAVVLSNRGERQDRVVDGMERAMRHRDRLTEVERYLTEGTFYMTVDDDPARAAVALRAAAEADPGNWLGWNNLAVVYLDQRRSADALDAIRRAVAAAPSQMTPRIALVALLGEAGRLPEAELALDSMRAGFRAHPLVGAAEIMLPAITGRFALAESTARRVLAETADQDYERTVKGWLAALTAVQGRLGEAERLGDEIAEGAARRGDRSTALLWTSQLAWMDPFIRGDPERAVRRLDAGARRYRPEHTRRPIGRAGCWPGRMRRSEPPHGRSSCLPRRGQPRIRASGTTPHSITTPRRPSPSRTALRRGALRAPPG